jgi:hypothetical protein
MRAGWFRFWRLRFHRRKKEEDKSKFLGFAEKFRGNFKMNIDEGKEENLSITPRDPWHHTLDIFASHNPLSNSCWNFIAVFFFNNHMKFIASLFIGI